MRLLDRQYSPGSTLTSTVPLQLLTGIVSLNLMSVMSSVEHKTYFIFVMTYFSLTGPVEVKLNLVQSENSPDQEIFQLLLIEN